MAAGHKILAQNKKARHDYFVTDTYEAGLALCGTEVKSIRLGKVNLKDSYVYIKGGEAFLKGCHISPYEQGNIFNRDPFRERKLLLHRSEIAKLNAQVAQKGYTLVPLQMYLSGGRVKLELGVCQGKKLFDKRDALAQKDAQREADREIKGMKF